MPDFIEVVQQIQSPADQLWAALTEPSHLKGWQSDTAQGSLASGKLTLGWPALGVEAELEVCEATVERQLVLSSGRSRVSFELEAGLLCLKHQGLVDTDELEGSASSWAATLAILAHYLEHHYGQRRQAHWAVTPALTTPQAAHVFFTDSAAMNSWLTRRASGIGPAGSNCEMLLAWGEPLTGRVLANAGERDIAISWSERDDSVLNLRTLPSPFMPRERILALCWSHWNCPGTDQAMVHKFNAALQALRQVLAQTGSA